MYEIYDGAGIETIADYDFKGNPLSFQRQFVADPTQHPDWGGTVSMETGIFHDEAQAYDALGRTISVTTPEGAVTSFTFNESGLPFSTSVSGVHSLNTDVVNEIYYNAKSQRIKVKYENTATTTYDYDLNTFRVTRIKTIRPASGGGTDILQDIQYQYDPVGNITLQTDGAHQPVYYSGTVASPDNDYTYDALYRLKIAGGRELAGNDAAPTYSDSSRVGITPVPISSTDTAAMRAYVQYYVYDAVGNMTRWSGFVIPTHMAGDLQSPYTSLNRPWPKHPLGQKCRSVLASVHTFTTHWSKHPLGPTMSKRPRFRTHTFTPHPYTSPNPPKPLPTAQTIFYDTTKNVVS